MEEVVITVGKDGSAEVRVNCVKGKKCSEITEQIEKALGAKIKDVPTHEMREVAHVQNRR